MQNETQYDLVRKAAKISALSSNDLEKYEYVAGKDLDLKPRTVEETRFEYSPLGRVFNRGLKDEDTKQGLVKRVKNIEDKNKELLKATRGKTDTKSKIGLFDEDLTSEAIALIREIKTIEKNVDYDKLSFTAGNKKVYGLDSFKTFEKLLKDIHDKNMTIDKAEVKQNGFTEKLDDLRAYPARDSKFIYLKESVSKNVEKIYEGLIKIVNGFKKENITTLVRKLIVMIKNQIF